MAWRLWLTRALVGIVLFFNLQCAVMFLLNPDTYAPAFELAGIPGKAMIQGMGILFLMWNIPYAFAVVNPIHNRLSLVEAAIMQSIGLAGESLLYSLLPAGHALLKGTAIRFILFDGVGLLLLLLGFCLALRWDLKLQGRLKG